MANDTIQMTINRNGTPWRQAKAFNTPLGLRVFREIISGTTYPIRPDFGDVQTIVDVGTNVGAAVLYFAMHYPKARVIGFEPNPEAYALLSENIAGLPRVNAHNFGLSDTNYAASLYFGKQDSVTASVNKSPENTELSVPVNIRDAAEALAEEFITVIDILKLDTEGCEIPCLRSISALLPGVGILFIEYHDEQDRLKLDQMLSSTHLLCHSRAFIPHRGELCYVSKRRLPLEFEGARISRT